MRNDQALIIIPTYNERENIGEIVPAIRAAVPGTAILVVDDNSPDGTADVVRGLAAGASGIHLMVRERKEGLGRAYIAGFKWALEREFACVFEMDADFSHDPKYLPAFLKTIDEADLVIGSRYINGVNVINWPMSRLLLSYGGNWYARMVTGLPVRDCTAGFKCFRREVLRRINLDRISASGYSFQIEMNLRAHRRGFRIKEIPIVFTDRTKGVSKMSTRIVREAILLPWKLRLATLLDRG